MGLTWNQRVLFLLLTAAAASPLIGALWHIRGTASTEGNLVGETPSRRIVDVSGRNLGWSFRDYGSDMIANTADDVVSDRVLRVPLGTEVELRLTSKDYIYQFSVPNLNLSQVAVPELLFISRFRATEPATYDLPPGALCNPPWFHEESMGQIIVQARRAS